MNVSYFIRNSVSCIEMLYLFSCLIDCSEQVCYCEYKYLSCARSKYFVCEGLHLIQPLAIVLRQAVFIAIIGHACKLLVHSSLLFRTGWWDWKPILWMIVWNQSLLNFIRKLKMYSICRYLYLYTSCYLKCWNDPRLSLVGSCIYMYIYINKNVIF